MKPLRFDIEAMAELTFAILDHESARPGYGALLAKATRDVTDLIERQPAIGSKITRTPCRQMIVAGFSYSVIYEETTPEIVVWAFAHHSRKPGYWKYRRRRP